MPKKDIIRIVAKTSGTIAASELAQREIALQESSDELVVKKTNNTLLRFGVGSGSLIQQPYQSFANLNEVRDFLVSAGVMLPRPTYVVSGVITGDAISGVALQLSGSSGTFNTTSAPSGAFSFSGVFDGVYTLTPTLAGYSFSPSSITVNVSGADSAGNNFASSLITASYDSVSASAILYESGFGQVRAFDIVGNTQYADTFSAVSGVSAIYTSIFVASMNRWFVPNGQSNSILVYEQVGSAFTLRATLNSTTLGGLGTIIRILYVGANKFLAIGTTARRFGFYNSTTDVWTQGSVLNTEVYPLDSWYDDGKIYIVSNNGGSPNRTLTIVDADAETIVTRTQLNGTMGFGNICVGSSAILVGESATPTNLRLFSKSAFSPIGSVVVTSSNPLRIGYSAGAFWMGNGNNSIRWIDETTGNSGAISLPAGTGTINGVVASPTRAYGVTSSGRVVVVDSAAKTEVANVSVGVNPLRILIS